MFFFNFIEILSGISSFQMFHKVLPFFGFLPLFLVSPVGKGSMHLLSKRKEKELNLSSLQTNDYLLFSGWSESLFLSQLSPSGGEKKKFSVTKQTNRTYCHHKTGFNKSHWRCLQDNIMCCVSIEHKSVDMQQQNDSERSDTGSVEPTGS